MQPAMAAAGRPHHLASRARRSGAATSFEKFLANYSGSDPKNPVNESVNGLGKGTDSLGRPPRRSATTWSTSMFGYSDTDDAAPQTSTPPWTDGGPVGDDIATCAERRAASRKGVLCPAITGSLRSSTGSTRSTSIFPGPRASSATSCTARCRRPTTTNCTSWPTPGRPRATRSSTYAGDVYRRGRSDPGGLGRRRRRDELPAEVAAAPGRDPAGGPERTRAWPT